MKKTIKVRKISALILVCSLIVSICCPMKAAATSRKNDYPLVLVYGFAGFSRGELLNYKYWGGFTDIQEVLTNSGYKTYTVTFGKFSSNWDRACELYACIKGGTVDYGEAHAKKYGHARFGRTYKGIYKKWGELSKGKLNKVHLIAHSMGGQTVRVLVQLLEKGSMEEKAMTKEGLSPLFEGENTWVQSITAISSTNDGTTIADVIDMKNYAKNLLSTFSAIAGVGKNEPLYDFDLEQWGLKRNEGESFIRYKNRVFDSNVWKCSNKDFSVYDMKTKGAAELNGWVKAQPNVYYFSWATKTTRKHFRRGRSYPNRWHTNPIFVPIALIMGRYTRNVPGLPLIDAKWFPNDGAVNCISQKGPHLNSKDKIVKYNGTPQIGKWNFMGMINNTDHMHITGTDCIMTRRQINWYEELAANAASLAVTN